VIVHGSYRPVALAVAAVMLAACGSSPSTTIPEAVDASTSTATTATAKPTEPLSIVDALLPDSAFAPPWEAQWRQERYVGYGVGPNQSSCPEYEVAESFAGRNGGQVFWWVDGGNANHFVARESYPGEGMAIVEMIGSAVERCDGTVSWGEGGSAALTPLDLGDGVTGFQFVTTPGDDLGYVAASTFGDLVSVLWVPMWPNGDGDFPDLAPQAFAQIAQQARRLLTTASVAAPDGLVPVTTTPGVDAPATVPPDGDALLLLDVDDLGPDWDGGGIEPYLAGGPDEGSLSACAAMQSMNDLDAVLAWETSFARNDGVSFAEAIGRSNDPSAAAALVAEFALIAECDPGAIAAADVVLDGGPIDVPGADVAGLLSFRIDTGDALGGMMLLAVGDVLVAVSIDTLSSSDLSQDQLMAELTELAAVAAERVAAG
jgi:hypothetical protein